MSLTGCATSGPVASDGCLWTDFILIHPDDVLTEETLRAIIKHDETREAICGAPEHEPQISPLPPGS